MILIEIINITRANTIHEIINNLRPLFYNTLMSIFCPSYFWPLRRPILAHDIRLSRLLQYFVGNFEILPLIVILMIVVALILYNVSQLPSCSYLWINRLNPEIRIKGNIFFSDILLVYVVNLIDWCDHILGVVSLRTAGYTWSVDLGKSLNVIFQFWLCVDWTLICLDYWIVLLRKLSLIDL